MWLVKKVEKRIDNWNYRNLSLGSRITLLRSGLVSIPIYCFSLTHVPQSILQMIRKQMFSYMWSSSSTGGKMHLVKWNTLTKPKALGGWDIKNIQWFSITLCMKNMERRIFGCGLW